jgi:hypothetical protein
MTVRKKTKKTKKISMNKVNKRTRRVRSQTKVRRSSKRTRRSFLKKQRRTKRNKRRRILRGGSDLTEIVDFETKIKNKKKELIIAESELTEVERLNSAMSREPEPWDDGSDQTGYGEYLAIQEATSKVYGIKIDLEKLENDRLTNLQRNEDFKSKDESGFSRFPVTLEIGFYRVPQINLTVKTLAGENVSVSVKVNGTVRDIKNAIYESRGSPPVNEQRILFKEEDLENNLKFRERGIKENSGLSMVLKEPGPQEEPEIIPIDPRDLEKEYDFNIDILPNITVRELKEEIGRVAPSGPDAVFRYNLELLRQIEAKSLSRVEKDMEYAENLAISFTPNQLTLYLNEKKEGKEGKVSLMVDERTLFSYGIIYTIEDDFEIKVVIS